MISTNLLQLELEEADEAFREAIREQIPLSENPEETLARLSQEYKEKQAALWKKYFPEIYADPR